MRDMLVAIVALQIIILSKGEDEVWEQVKLPKELLSPIIKVSNNTGTVKVCLPVITKWVRFRSKLKGRMSRRMRMNLQRKWKRIHHNVMDKMANSSFRDILTFTIKERTNTSSMFLSVYFKVPESVTEEGMVLSCSDKDEVDQRNCAGLAKVPPMCFSAITQKMIVDKIYTIPISKQLGIDKSLGIFSFKEDDEECSC